jgi:Ca-activated chloride channel family protein
MRKRKKLTATFIERALWPEIMYSLNMRRHYIKIIIVSTAIILSILSLTRPQFSFTWEEAKSKGLDIIFAVDTSKSMLCQDIRPNRLERSKLAIKDLLTRLKGDRIALVAFAGRAFLQCPLTLDYDGFLLALEDLSIDTIPRGGTSISTAIQEAMKAYDPVEKKYRVLILISDGEEHEGDALKTAKTAKEEKIKIFTIGVGSNMGAFIPIADREADKDFLRDEQGNRVKSQLNEKLLKDAAFLTGGAYVHSTSTDFGLDSIYRESISRLERREIAAKKTKRYHEHFQIPLSIAVFLLCLEAVITRRKNRR